MTNVRPNALTLSVAIAISSSMIGTQALADRRLQTKSVDIHGNGHAEFTQSEVIVQPTLGDDQQPIPKSFTTTYPDQTEVRAGYDIPSEGFTDVLSGIVGGVSIVDQFETDENNVAQKYTKVLKVGNEGVFKFTHNLAERKLLIEVRDRMTHQDSIKAVRVQLGNTQTLEPFTKVASPEHLVGVLKGAHERAGNLGEVDHYVALATLKVNKVKVNGRTFLRLLASAEQPPELRRLGQSLFVNDEALLAAATSAYAQVHVLGEDIQQQALNKLLSYHKPVGYVVHVEDDTQPYPVPEGYPKLEVTEAPGEIIVFRSQKQNPTDLAFVEGLHDMWEEESSTRPPSDAKTQIKKDKVKSYQYTIRSRQMALLEGLAAEHNAGPEEDGEITLAYDHDLMIALSQYEYLYQALTSANLDGADEFELTIGQIEIASSVVTPTWMHNQLKKYFSFKPALRNLLTNQFFIQNIQKVISGDSDIIRVQADDPGDEEELASKVVSNKPRELIEIKIRQEELLAKESELTQLRNQLKLTTEKTSTSEKEQLRALQLRQQIEDKLVQFHQELGQQKNQIQTLQRQVSRIPSLEKQLSSIRAYAIIAQYSITASRLGIDDWIDTLPLEVQSRRISERIKEIFRIYAATGQPDEEALKAKPAAIGGKRGIAPVNKKNLATLQSIQQQLQQAPRQPDALDSETLTTFEGQLGITNSQHDPLDRRRTIQQHLKHQAIKIFQTHIQNQQEHEEPKEWLQKLLQEIEHIPELKQQARDASAGALKVRNAQIAIELGIDNWDVTQPPEEQARIIRKKILEIKQLAAATTQPDEEAVKAKAPTNEDDLATLQFIRPPKQQRLQQNEEPSDGEIQERLAFCEGKLGLVPENEDDLEARNRWLQQRIKQLSLEIHQQNVENQQKLAKRSSLLHFLQEEADRIPILRKKAREVTAAAIKDYNTQIAAKLGIDNWDGTQTLEEQARLINQKISEIKQPVAPTSIAPTSIAPTSIAPTSIAPTSIAPTSIAPTSIAPTSIAPTSIAPTSIAPTSVAATSVAATSIAPTSVTLTSVAPTSVAATPVSATEQTREEPANAERATIEHQLGPVPESEKDPEVCCQAIQQHHKEQETQTDQQYLQQRSITTDAEKETEIKAEIKARYTTIAVRLGIEDFDSNADIDVQQECLVQKLETMNAEAQRLRQQLNTMSIQLDMEDFYTDTRKVALAGVLGIDPNDNTALSDRAAVESAVYTKLNKLKFLDTYVDYIRTGNSEVMPEVRETLSDMEKTLQMRAPDEKDDVYLRRQAISEEIWGFISKARQRSEEKALAILKAIEEILDIKVNEEDDKTTRLIRVRRMFDGDDLTDHRLDKIHNTLWADEDTAPDGRDLKVAKLLAYLHYKVGGSDPDQRAREQQTDPLAQVEEALFGINFNEQNDRTARLARVLKILGYAGEYQLGRIDQSLWKEDSEALDEKGLRLKKLDASLTYKVEDPYRDKQVIEQLTRLIAAIEDQLHIHPLDCVVGIKKVKAFTAKLASDLMMNFDNDASLSEQKDTLMARIQAFRDEVNQVYEDETARRARNNEMAHQLNIKDYNDDASINDQNSLINAKLQLLDEEVIDKVQPDVNARILIIENELDRHMARLGPKPRYVLDREAATARAVLKKAESELKAAHQKLDAMVQPGGDGASGSKVQQPIQEQARLEAEIEVRKADIERMKSALKVAEKTVENDGGPFQYTPGQVKVMTDMHGFIHQHALKKQALEAAMGLAASAAKSAKVIPQLSTFDFDDEFAPIRLQAMVGKDLTFHQASRIVRVFRNLKRNFSPSSFELEDDQSQDVLEEVGVLVQRIRNELGKGPQQYDEVINGMGKMAIHFVKYEEEDLKSFLEYFATRFASGNKIITLLREGLISKVELENYIKAVRGVDGYQTVAEFEHFLGDKQGVRVPEFRKVIQMLSDEGAEQFMGIAITPVTVTATGPAGMKESVDGMKEYAAAVIANYVLDDIAFENGRRTAAFLANVQETLTPYANAAGLSQSELIQAIHDTLMQAHAAAVEQQLNDYWVKPSAFLVQAVTWYYTSYKPLLVTHTARQAAELSLSNMSFLYLLDLTNRGDYLHRMLTPFQHWLERYGVDPDRTGQYAYHNGIEQVSEVGGLAMPLGKAASSVILLSTGSMLFARQYNANPHRYRSISRMVPEIVKSMGSRQGVQVPLLHRVTPQKVKTLASATAALVLGPVATVGTYAHGLISGFTYAQTFGVALASSLTFDFFMNDNKMLTQWLGGPLGRSLDKMNRWIGLGETQDEYVKRTAIAAPQYFSETDEEYAYRVKANNTMYGWTRHENYLQFRERRDRTMRLFENGWEKYFRENIPEWSFSHAKSIPYSYTLGTFYEWGDKKATRDEL
ncbi:hypothetical protein [Endozoicomonas sp. 8E]|uniref:hypothetical protein n=1 Tax=Endozoicomonas sp. 8E TaxID=3035692 RepID=UPI0029391748|nr:hypothetical protein [Endozoicomonas sp. 8E]WOG29549.1 hypothetical protein P6910_07835 [Endozoicomonas sp. 8E]